MVFATMGNTNLEAASINWKLICHVVSFFPFRKCKCGTGKPQKPGKSTSATSNKQATVKDFNKKAVKAAANANNYFGNVLLKIVAKPEQNLIMSSYSVSSVLNMILNGAKGSTASQLKQGLKVKNFDVIKNGFKDALTLMKSNENYTLKAANRYVN